MGDVSFANNIAGDGGGALLARYSKLSRGGDSYSFINNSASDSGGALFVSHSSWARDALFANNTVDGLGSALYVLNSHVQWAGDTLFADGIADEGGALLVDGSNVSLMGYASQTTTPGIMELPC